MPKQIEGTIADINTKKYMYPPTWEQIESFIKEVGMTKYRFEIYYGISQNHLAKVKCGLKQLGRAYWHIFYERIIPEYGVGYYKNHTPLYIPKRLPKEIPKSIPKLITNHSDTPILHYQTNVANIPDNCENEHDNHDRLKRVK